MSVTFKRIIPESESNPLAESWEWMLAWYGRQGELYWYLFTDRLIQISISAEPINEENSDNVRSLINDRLETITLTAENITRNEYDVLTTILESKDVFRVFKDGTYQRLAVVSSENEIKDSAQRTQLEINVQLPREPVSR